MTRPDRHRVTIELGKLRAQVFALSNARGVSASELVRELLAAALSVPLAAKAEPKQPAVATSGQETRVWLRMAARDAESLYEAAKAHRISVGALVAGLVAGVPALTAEGARVPDYVKALIAACVEMSTLSRDLRHLASLLSQGQVHAALEYRAMLTSLENDVRQYVNAASEALAQLQARPDSIRRRAMGRRWPESKSMARHKTSE